MQLQKRVVGIGGGAGAGTEAVAEMLRRLGYFTVDADVVAQQVTRKAAAGYQQIVQRWGSQFLGSTGELDRQRLYLAARTEPGLMEQIRAIVYPLVKQQLQAIIGGTNEPLVFIRANDLEAYGLRGLCDQAWVVQATDEARVAGLVKDREWSLPLARQYVRSQPPDVGTHRATVILNNTGSHGDLWRQVARAVRALDVRSQPAVQPPAPPAVTAALSEPIHASEPAASAVPVLSAAEPSPAAEAEAAPFVEPALQPKQEARTESLLSLQLKLIVRQTTNAILILLALAVLASWGLILAEYGRNHVPISALQAAWQALLRTAQYLTAHPQTYYWAKEEVPWLSLVSGTLGRSAGLLLLSMIVGLVIALPLGIAAASARRRALPAIVMVLSVLGASTPSFLLAMMLWVANIFVHQTFNIRVLPATGFGWDAHLVMPVLVLAMRPLAQIAQVTYVTMSDVLREDYIRTGHAKGLSWRVIRNRHALPNVLIPILNTAGSSLRFSLASLPIVEVFFRWPGTGSMLLDAINAGTVPLVLDLILALGAFFLLVNLLIDFSFALIDPRLQMEVFSRKDSDGTTARESLQQAWNIAAGWVRGLPGYFALSTWWRQPQGKQNGGTGSTSVSDSLRRARHQWIRRSLLHNPTLIVTTLVLLLLVALAIVGPNLPGVSPYEIHGVMSVNGKYAAPPFKPSTVFPWGTDHIGRDMRSLVLAGAQKTLSLAFFGMLARVLLGTVLGILAGWGRGGRFDRLVSGTLSIWAAFPATLFAMIVIQALGIQQGMWVFVAAICIVGWGEVAQFVRGQVIALKPSQFVESARSVGARADQILVRHILPNLANPLIVLAALEMGGVLMLLAELGFLNIFMGGGFKTMVGETGSMQAIISYYSDVPEWGALIANVRAQWRAYPWMALYPGLAVLISILAFNLFGEGLRRFLEDSAVSLSRFFNRYTFTAGACVVAILVLLLRSALPINVYRAQGMKFDEQRVLQDIRLLSSPELQGRETGTSGATLAALYIAHRMAEIGIFPAGEHYTYLQHQVQPRLHMISLPTLAFLDRSGAVIKDLAYRQDFIEMTRSSASRGEAQAPVMGVAYGPIPEGSTKRTNLRYTDAAEHVIIVREADLPKVEWTDIAGILVVADDPGELTRRYVYPAEAIRSDTGMPCLVVTPEVADSLLKTAGSSLKALDALRASLAPGETQFTGEGFPVKMSLDAVESSDPGSEKYINVIGVIPGQGTFMGTEEQIIMVSAYYDGLGTDPSGALYPGANDNASGVAMMLELARLLKESDYQPDKTVLFVAWAGGERQEGLSTVNILNARPGASEMTVETVLELSGVGYGTGKAISIGSDSSYRMVQLFQQAASRYRVPTTTRGRSPHYDLPAKPILGGRDAMTLSLSWDGSDDLAHTPQDTASLIDPNKLRDIGRPAFLTLLVLCRETEY